MALFMFTRAIIEGTKIDVFNHGQHQRDLTYIDDIVTGLTRVLDQPAEGSINFDPARPDPAISSAPWRIYNIGNEKPIGLMRLIEILEVKLDRKADINMMPRQLGDALTTWSDTSDIKTDFDYQATTSVEEGIGKFVDWYIKYHSLTPAL